MSVGIIAAIIAVVAIGLFLMWRGLRLLIRLAIAGVIVFLIAGLFAWRYWAGDTSRQDNHPAKTRKNTGR